MFEIALKQNLPVNFQSFPLEQVARESGPPHMRSSVTRVSVGVLVGEGKSSSVLPSIRAQRAEGYLGKRTEVHLCTQQSHQLRFCHNSAPSSCS